MSARVRRVPTAALLRISTAVLAPALLLAGCAAGGPQLPERPGIYAKTDGERARLIRLSDRGAGGWSAAASLPEGADLLVANAGMGSDPSLFDDYVTLTRAGWVRSRIGPDGAVRPTTGQQYAAPDLADYRVRLSFSYLGQEGGLDIVRVRPESPLSRGYYQLEVAPAASRDMRARFGVQTAELDRERYAQNNCLDRMAGSDAGYRPCSADTGNKRAAADEAASGAGVGAVEQQNLKAPSARAQGTGGAAGAEQRAAEERPSRATSDSAQRAAGKPAADSLTPGLHIRDLSVDRARREDGDVLLIRGEVVNADTEKHELPGLKGRIIDPGGEVLQRWTFLPNARALAPGESARFTTVRDATEEGGKRVEIRFEL